MKKVNVIQFMKKTIPSHHVQDFCFYFYFMDRDETKILVWRGKNSVQNYFQFKSPPKKRFFTVVHFESENANTGKFGISRVLVFLFLLKLLPLASIQTDGIV